MAPRLRLIVPAVALTATVFAACGDDEGGATLSPEGEQGRKVFNSKGCSSCHGNNVGPDLEGVFGSDVELEDGSTVLADEAYIERAITDPGAERVAGFSVNMPEANVSDEEVAQLIAYIRDIGADPSGSSSSSGSSDEEQGVGQGASQR